MASQQVRTWTCGFDTSEHTWRDATPWKLFRDCRERGSSAAPSRWVRTRSVSTVLSTLPSSSVLHQPPGPPASRPAGSRAGSRPRANFFDAGGANAARRLPFFPISSLIFRVSFQSSSGGRSLDQSQPTSSASARNRSANIYPCRWRLSRRRGEHRLARPAAAARPLLTATIRPRYSDTQFHHVVPRWRQGSWRRSQLRWTARRNAVSGPDGRKPSFLGGKPPILRPSRLPAGDNAGIVRMRRPHAAIGTLRRRSCRIVARSKMVGRTRSPHR